VQARLWDRVLATVQDVEATDLRDILANNLKALMAARPHLDTFPKIVKAGGPSNGTLDRIRRKDSGCSIDQLAKLAAVFELEPWQLLTKNLEPNNAPILLGAGGDAERALWAKVNSLMNEIAELRDGAASRPTPLT
jgi:hypothetical protein